VTAAMDDWWVFVFPVVVVPVVAVAVYFSAKATGFSKSPAPKAVWQPPTPRPQLYWPGKVFISYRRGSMSLHLRADFTIDYTFISVSECSWM
jgi:hypothetical protein